MIRDIIYRRPHLEHVKNLVSLISKRRTVTKWKRFVTINCFYYQYSAANVFLSVYEAVNEPPVPQHVQGKDHVFQALTLE